MKFREGDVITIDPRRYNKVPDELRGYNETQEFIVLEAHRLRGYQLQPTRKPNWFRVRIEGELNGEDNPIDECCMLSEWGSILYGF